MKKLPIGIQSFEVMRTQGYLYVDKTRDIYRLVNEGMFYFLARPRRFGKSLLVSTLQCLFQGRRDLFRGLWLAEQGDWDWQAHPVLVVDFNGIARETPQRLRQSLKEFLSGTAQEAGIALQSSLLVPMFRELILGLHKKAGRPVVILIDEYDKPLVDHLGRGEEGLAIAKANRDTLRSFFGVLKDAAVSDVLRFVFLTGVSRFSRVSIFSQLNNLNDVSMHDAYATMLGYTQAEMDRYFAEHRRRLAERLGVSEEEAREALAQYYDGYRFAERAARVYNPFSVLQAFDHQRLGNYWFESGTPRFLVDLLRQQGYEPPRLEGLQVSRSVFTAFDIDYLVPEALLFQTGYLTIVDVEEGIYTLDYPNREVKTSFTEWAGSCHSNGTLTLIQCDSNEHVDSYLRMNNKMKEEVTMMVPLVRPFISIFESVPDHRQAKGRRHPLVAVLAIVTLALINQQNSIPQIAAWAQGLSPAARKRLPLRHNRLPSESTIRRVLQDLDVDTLRREAQKWVEEMLAAFYPTADWSGLALDAKTLRGSGGDKNHPPALRLLGAFVHELGVFLQDQTVPAHTNELGIASVFLEDLCLTGRVVTADALLTQKEVARTIVERQGHYLLRVKANQPQLLEDLQTWFADPSPWSQAENVVYRYTEKGHGRLVRYTLRTTEALNQYLQEERHWPRVGQAFCLERRCTYLRSGQTTTEIHYGITSLSFQQADPATLLRLWRQHWHIENKGHWVLDVVLAEDRTRLRRGAEALAVLRRLVITLLRLSGQHGVTATRAALSADVQQAMSLIGLPLEFY